MDSVLPEYLKPSLEILQLYRGQRQEIDRAEVVAHATLSAWAHHWPDQVSMEIRVLLEDTREIRALERSRWMTQRRIAISKLVRLFDASESFA